ncbi:MAG TPA: FAD-binding oxidoreductase [Candidatus Dormibacteraeota bacterium]|nr:FAD-binding oxidoreductase [Candidatus Dormibacteraeota bacterium]
MAKRPGSSSVDLAAASNSELVEALRLALPADQVFTARHVLEEYTADTYWKALAARAAGSPLGRPDVVVKPRRDEDVAAVLRVANQHRVPVVAWGGGSGTQGASLATRGGIVIDMTDMSRIIEVDDVSLTVTAEAGLNGKELETELNGRGLMLPHYPASVELATVGGYVAARGSGVLSTRYGKIEDLVLSMRVVTPTGEIVDTLAVPRHAVGPDIGQLFIGSEGMMGIITRVRLQLAPLPEARRFEVVSFPSVESGVEAVRKGLQGGLRPSVVRMYDEVATRLTLSPVVGQDLPGVSTILCFEGDPGVVAAERDAMLASARSHGAKVLDGMMGETWWEHRYDFYKPPHAPELPAVWGTIDVVAPYARIMATYHALQAAVARPYAERGLKLRSHLSHWYPWGAMIYARFVLPDGGSDAMALHDRIWKDGVTAALDAGAVMNDHHGVGLKLAPYMRAQHGNALEVLRQVQRALDPNGVMNPGKLGL